MGGGDASRAKGGGLAALGAAALRVVRGGMLGLIYIRSSKVTSKNAKWAEVRGDRHCGCVRVKAVCAAATVTLVTTVNVAKLAKQAFACEPVTHVTRVITRVTESVTREKHTNAAVLHLLKSLGSRFRF